MIRGRAGRSTRGYPCCPTLCRLHWEQKCPRPEQRSSTSLLLLMSLGRHWPQPPSRSIFSFGPHDSTPSWPLRLSFPCQLLHLQEAWKRCKFSGLCSQAFSPIIWQFHAPRGSGTTSGQHAVSGLSPGPVAQLPPRGHLQVNVSEPKFKVFSRCPSNPMLFSPLPTPRREWPHHPPSR